MFLSINLKGAYQSNSKSTFEKKNVFLFLDVACEVHYCLQLKHHTTVSCLLARHKTTGLGRVDQIEMSRAFSRKDLVEAMYVWSLLHYMFTSACYFKQNN